LIYSLFIYFHQAKNILSF